MGTSSQRQQPKHRPEPEPAAAIAVLGMGTMGATVAAAYKASGYRVMTDLSARSEMSIRRATDRGIEVADDLVSLVRDADIVFSIVPPDQALAVSEGIARCAKSMQDKPLLVEANAVAPRRMRQIFNVCRNARLPLLDGGIVGGPPTEGTRPRLYLSGTRTGDLAPLDGLAFDHMVLGAEIGQASMFKMLYAGLTKGLNTLLVNQLLAAEKAGLFGAYVDELAQSQAVLLRQAERVVPRMPADSARWEPEMREIAATLADLDLPVGFHRAAERVMARLATSPFARETRETVDLDRTLHGTLRNL